MKKLLRMGKNLIALARDPVTVEFTGESGQLPWDEAVHAQAESRKTWVNKSLRMLDIDLGPRYGGPIRLRPDDGMTLVVKGGCSMQAQYFAEEEVEDNAQRVMLGMMLDIEDVVEQYPELEPVE